MRGYKNFEGTPHPGDLCHLVEIGYTENVINENGYPEPKDVVLCRVWASAVDAGNQHYRAADVMNTDQVMELYELRQRQSLPLEAKITMSLQRIREWHEHLDGQVYVR